MTDAGARRYDVVVVGAGVAGLAAASRLLDRDVLVLEQADRLGGRLHSRAGTDGNWVNFGAHLLTGGHSRIAELIEDSGLVTMPVPGVKSALWFGERLHRSRRVESYPFVLPLTIRERWALVRIGLRIRVLAEKWRRAGVRRPGESWPDFRRRFAAFESARPFAALLEGAPNRVAAVFRTAARRSGGAADDVTAGAALSIFGALWVGSASGSVTNVRGGAGLLGDHWHTRLGSRAVLGADVVAVDEERGRVTITYRTAAGEQAVTADQVIVAAPAPVAAAMLTSAPAEIRDRLRDVAYGPFVCVSVTTDDIGDTPWDDVYAITTPGLSFDMLFHHTSSVRTADGRTPGRKSLMCYAGGDHGREWAHVCDEDLQRAFVSDIERVMPHTRGAVRDVVVTRWTRGNCYPTPGGDLTPVIEWNARPDGRVRLAGDYFAALGGTADAAAGSGYAAAASVRAGMEAATSKERVG